MSKQNPTNLAGGQRKAQFVIGAPDIDAPVELKNVAPEGSREDFVVIPVDHSRPMKRLTPKRDQILVQRRESENITTGGILLPTETVEKDKPAEGTILAIGPKVEDIKVGDHVLFGQYAGTEYAWGVEVLLFMREEEVIATVEE